jgi:long-subunit fatty acid transport protein
MGRNILVSIVLLLLMSTSAFCQEGNENPYKGRPIKERLFFGGDLGLSFGTVTYIRIVPLVGYQVSPKFSFGAGPSFQYWDDSRFPTSAQTIWGGQAFARYFVFPELFLQSDFEFLNLEAFAIDNSGEVINTRVNVPVWWLGAGYSQRSANGSGFFIGLFYDIVQDINSPYADPFAIRIGGFFAL